jgi:heme oxygenase (biliverdin-IX-beta and delta-forming)
MNFQQTLEPVQRVDRRCGILRVRLRDATAEVHQRLHAHPGLAAAAMGKITLPDYRLLLMRIYGFHRPLESRIIEAAPALKLTIDVKERARWPLLVEDLVALGVDLSAISALPLWAQSRRVANRGRLLGALYVLEGSAMGGTQIAQALSGVVGTAAGDGRRFFLGHGSRRGAMWRSLLHELETIADGAEANLAVQSATRVFEGFEAWMDGWRTKAAKVAALST